MRSSEPITRLHAAIQGTGAAGKPAPNGIERVGAGAHATAIAISAAKNCPKNSANPPETAVAVADPAAEARRRRVLAMLEARPSIQYAVLADLEADPEVAIITLAIRGRATCEFHIPREKYNGVLLLDLIERHGGTVH